MTFHQFLEDLFQHGRVIVASEFENLEATPELLQILAQFEVRIRPTLPPSLPTFLPEIAFWAATRLYRACQFLFHDNDPEETICQELLLDICPLPRSPEVDYSVDLALRFLPSLNHHLHTRHIADPLRDALRQFGREWPLSSVGMPDLGTHLLTPPFQHQEALRRLYLDRIITYQDWSRLQDPWIKPYWKQTIGAFPPPACPPSMENGLIAG